jgi:hypothetical protein
VSDMTARAAPPQEEMPSPAAELIIKLRRDSRGGWAVQLAAALRGRIPGRRARPAQKQRSLSFEVVGTRRLVSGSSTFAGPRWQPEICVRRISPGGKRPQFVPQLGGRV